MPLPASNTPWPPKQLEQISPALETWDAWWVGDPDRLAAVYGGAYGSNLTDRANQIVHPNQLRGGIAGAAARFWWGKPRTDLASSQEPRRLHLPVAADLCQASADLLFADPPKITSTNKDTQDRLDQYVEDGLITHLAEAAEIGAALGTTYLRASWDETLSERPFLSSVDADAAWPEFRQGRMVAVTFWWVVKRDGSRIWRHLERHELNPSGNGVILHGLFEGNSENLGAPRPLTEVASLQGVADSLDDDQVIDTATPGLAVAMVRNQSPVRRWRTDPIGRHLGRSDLDGVEGFMDALDETWSSWMRDIDLGKGRIIAAESVLDDEGPGRGTSFDTERAIFTPLRVLQSRDQSGLPIEAVQFEIRVAQHQQTCQEILTQILRTAGYSQQTFGEGSEGVKTATEVTSQDERSLLTRDRKLRAWAPAVNATLRKLLAIDRVLLKGGSLDPESVSVSFPEAVQDSPLELAQTAMALKSAEAASTKTLVRTVHPDWDDTQVDVEVGLILSEQPTPLADPFGAHPTDGVDQAPVDDPAVDDATS